MINSARQLFSTPFMDVQCFVAAGAGRNVSALNATHFSGRPANAGNLKLFSMARTRGMKSL
jgi:hypothetical protein